MNRDEVLVEFTINEKGEVQLRLADIPTGEPNELVFTPIHEGQPPVTRPLSKRLKEWLRTTKPVSLDDLQRIMASSPLPTDPSTISICDKRPS
jgi:putative SOS response-associated peptidase YedK